MSEAKVPETSELIKRIDDHEKRVRDLETDRASHNSAIEVEWANQKELNNKMFRAVFEPGGIVDRVIGRMTLAEKRVAVLAFIGGGAGGGVSSGLVVGVVMYFKG